MMLSFFQLMLYFRPSPLESRRPQSQRPHGIGAFNLVRRSAYESVGTYAALRFEVVDDMKLGKVIKNAGFRQRTRGGK